MKLKSKKNTLEYIVSFLNSITIDVVEKKLPTNTFLPGLSLKGNSILMDVEQLKYPGDLLHEAGHIAVTEKSVRPLIGSKKTNSEWPSLGDEIAAILWSYAASYHLKLDLEVVFHPYGYKNESKWYIEQFNNKNYIGLPLLNWMGLCNTEDFPKLKKWLRD